MEEKSTGARNDYLLCLAAANAHQTRYNSLLVVFETILIMTNVRYFVIDLQLGMNAMESGVYDKVAEYLTLMGIRKLTGFCLQLTDTFQVELNF